MKAIIFLILFIVLFTSTLIFILIKNHRQNFNVIRNSIHDCLSFLGNNQLYCREKPSKDKIIGWEWDRAGFNNTRMAIEIIFGLSIIYDRTLILPPHGSWAHLPGKDCCKIEDFYDLDALKTTFSVMTSEEYFGKKIKNKEYNDYFRKNDNLHIKEQDKNFAALASRWDKCKTLFEEKNNEKIWYINVRMFGNLDDYFRNSKDLKKDKEANI